MRELSPNGSLYKGPSPRAAQVRVPLQCLKISAISETTRAPLFAYFEPVCFLGFIIGFGPLKKKRLGSSSLLVVFRTATKPLHQQQPHYDEEQVEWRSPPVSLYM